MKPNLTDDLTVLSSHRRSQGTFGTRGNRQTAMNNTRTSTLRLLPTVGATVLWAALAAVSSAATILHNFSVSTSDGAVAQGGPILVGSKLYGMTNQGGSSNCGSVYSMNTDGSGFTLLHSFIGGPTDGLGPTGALAVSGSKLYEPV